MGRRPCSLASFCAYANPGRRSSVSVGVYWVEWMAVDGEWRGQARRGFGGGGVGGGGVTFFDGPLRRKGLCWLPLWLFLVSVSKGGALFSQGTFSARGNGDGQFHSRPFTTAQGCPSITLLILSRFAPLHTEVAGHHECALSRMLQMALLQM